MSTMINTFDEIEEGAEVAVLTQTGVQRWTYADHQLRSRDGTLLDPWFFIGYLNDGKVMLGNFSPPAVGDWFTQPNGRGHLVVKTDPDQTTAYCARFLDGERFYDFVTLHHVVDTHQRAERPAWITQPYVDMAALAYGWQQEMVKANQKMRDLHHAQNQVRYARDNLNSALEAMTR